MVSVRPEFAVAVETESQLTAWPGYVGRFLALYIHNEKLASEVRLIDKQLPELAFLAPEFSEACARDKFMQADASKERRQALQIWIG